LSSIKRHENVERTSSQKRRENVAMLNPNTADTRPRTKQPQMGLSFRQHQVIRIARFIKNIALGVSICLDVVSISTLDLDTVKKLVSTIEKISTVSKSLSRRLRSLDRDREISILSRHHHPDPNISIEIDIYQDLSRFTKNLDNISIEK
jgi:hypothetical protein